jgi:hypothetical protein
MDSDAEYGYKGSGTPYLFYFVQAGHVRGEVQTLQGSEVHYQGGTLSSSNVSPDPLPSRLQREMLPTYIFVIHIDVIILLLRFFLIKESYIYPVFIFIVYFGQHFAFLCM